MTDDGAKSPTALLFAGNSSHTIATPIAAVLDRFGVTIDPTVPEVEPPPDPDPDPEPAISLAANGYKVRGMQKVDLTWSGAGTAQVDITREGSALVTVANTGAYTDNIDQRGGGSYTYQVCEAGSATCSDEVTVIF